MRAKFRIIGFNKSVEGVALVDTGASLTLLDKSIAEEISVKYVGRRVRIVTADCHEVEAELAIVDRLVVEDEESPFAYVAVMNFPSRLREKLQKLSLCDYCIIGLISLELLQLIPDTVTGKLRKSSVIFL